MDNAGRKTRCLVVDDEPLAIKLITNHIQQVEALEIVASCKNALQALEILRKEQVDLVFLDIRMPQISGLEFLRTLTHPPKVILTTAYREYALDGFELDVIDYLLKPISFERFLKSVNKYYERIETNAPHSLKGTTFSEGAHILVRDNKTNFRVLLNDILFIEAFGEYMKIHTFEKVHLSRESMHDLESRLPPGDFIRVHKSYIVPFRKITAYSTLSVFIGKQEIPIGRSYKNAVSEMLKGI